MANPEGISGREWCYAEVVATDYVSRRSARHSFLGGVEAQVAGTGQRKWVSGTRDAAEFTLKAFFSNVAGLLLIQIKLRGRAQKSWDCVLGNSTRSC